MLHFTNYEMLAGVCFVRLESTVCHSSSQIKRAETKIHRFGFEYLCARFRSVFASETFRASISILLQNDQLSFIIESFNQICDCLQQKITE